MKIAVVGSRNVSISLSELDCHLSVAHEIVGGAKGMGLCASQYACLHHIPFTEFLPQQGMRGKRASHVRNEKMVEYADEILVFWDGKSQEELSVICYAKKVGKTCRIILITP